MKRQTKLKAALFESGVTQRELAGKTGIPANYISRFLSGRFNLTEEEKAKIGQALRRPISELFA
jgi:transcriptional regulator with XRE-family HTH domain